MSAFLRSQWLCFPPCSVLVCPCQQDRLRVPCLSDGGRYQSLTCSFVHSLAPSLIVQQVEWFPGARLLPGNEESTVNKTGTSSPSWHQRTWVGRGYKPTGSSKTLVKRAKERIQRGKGVSVWGGGVEGGEGRAEKGCLTAHLLTADLEEGSVEGWTCPDGVAGASGQSPVVGGPCGFQEQGAGQRPEEAAL